MRAGRGVPAPRLAWNGKALMLRRAPPRRRSAPSESPRPHPVVLATHAEGLGAHGTPVTRPHLRTAAKPGIPCCLRAGADTGFRGGEVQEKGFSVKGNRQLLPPLSED